MGNYIHYFHQFKNYKESPQQKGLSKFSVIFVSWQFRLSLSGNETCLSQYLFLYQRFSFNSKNCTDQHITFKKSWHTYFNFIMAARIEFINIFETFVVFKFRNGTRVMQIVHWCQSVCRIFASNVSWDITGDW